MWCITTTVHLNSNISIIQAKGSLFLQHKFLGRNPPNPNKVVYYYFHVKLDLNEIDVIVDRNCYPMLSSRCQNISKPPNTLA